MRYAHPENQEPTVSVEIDGNNYTFTTQSLIDTIKKDEAYRTEIKELERKLLSLKYDVKEFFQARYETDSDEIICEVGDVNSLLKDIGSDELTKSWSATVVITATVTGIEGPNQEAVEDIIKDSIDVNFTEDGDLWVDDITVDGIHPES